MNHEEIELIDNAIKEINSRNLRLADRGFVLDILLDLRKILTNK